MNLKILKCEERVHCKPCRTDPDWCEKALGIREFDCPYGVTAESLDQTKPELVGTELSNILHKIGINWTSKCKCSDRSTQMNEQGLEWCKDNKDIIIGWMKEEAKKRNLPFSKFLAKKLLNLAIRRVENQSH